MPDRIIAISDIHGCSAALRAVLEAIRPGPDDTIITLGDYGDRGPDTRGVFEMLLALQRQTRLVPLLGNHDEMMLNICEGRQDLFTDWLVFGGNTTLASYDTLVPGGIWPAHLDLVRNCRLFHETEEHFFVHGSYLADVPLEAQPRDVLFWESLKRRLPGRHRSGKTAIVGHTAQRSGEILDLGYLKCIDTCCYGDGWLTALDIGSGQVWQVNKEGRWREK